MRVTPDTSAAIDGAVWATARRLEVFSYGSLASEAHVSIERATRLVRHWQMRHAVTEAGLGDRGRKLFRLSAEEMPVAPAAREAGGTPQGNLWRAMQLLKSFTPTDLYAHSNTPTVRVSAEDATAYCQTLQRAGYLRVERKAVPGKREAIYRLTRNTGPQAPVLKRVRAVVDPNLGQIVHVAGGLQ